MPREVACEVDCEADIHHCVIGAAASCQPGALCRLAPRDQRLLVMVRAAMDTDRAPHKHGKVWLESRFASLGVNNSCCCSALLSRCPRWDILIPEAMDPPVPNQTSELANLIPSMSALQVEAVDISRRNDKENLGRTRLFTEA